MVTDVDGPSAPLITNLTCNDEHSIYLEWERPGVVYKNIDSYLVYYRSEDKWQFEEVVLERNGSKPVGSMVCTVQGGPEVAPPLRRFNSK